MPEWPICRILITLNYFRYHCLFFIRNLLGWFLPRVVYWSALYSWDPIILKKKLGKHFECCKRKPLFFNQFMLFELKLKITCIWDHSSHLQFEFEITFCIRNNILHSRLHFAGTDYFVLAVCCWVRFLFRCITRSTHMGELTVWIVFPTVAIHMYRSSPLVSLDSCLTAAACLSSAC